GGRRGALPRRPDGIQPRTGRRVKRPVSSAGPFPASAQADPPGDVQVRRPAFQAVEVLVSPVVPLGKKVFPALPTPMKGGRVVYALPSDVRERQSSRLPG